MTVDLSDELRRMADGPQPATPPGDLWTRGVRRRRRARALTALATATVLSGAVVTGTVGWDAVRALDSQPVARTDAPALPDRLGTPSPWLETTADGGPLGPVAVIAGAERKSPWGAASSRVALYGVSAVTGEYRFLDFPGMTSGDGTDSPPPPSLSPDGRSVAYVVAEPGSPDRVGGFAVYDTVTGEVTEELVDSELGLVPEALTWVSPSTVLLSYGVITERRSDGWSARDARDLLWTPRDGEPAETVGESRSVSDAWPVPGGYAVGTARNLVVRDLSDGSRISSTRLLGADGVQDVTVDPTGQSVLGFPDTSSGLSRTLKVGQMGAGAARLGEVRTDLRMDRPALGWTDRTHVVVRGVDDADTVGAYAVDVESGEHTLLVREDWAGFRVSPAYASHLWQTPPVSRPAPERIIDPRLRAAGAAGLVLTGGFLVLVLRRRRAPR